MSKPPPYICGPVIYEHQYFYGREREINQLGHFLDQATSPEAEAGQAVFVAGPLKVGKTSLVQRFQRRLELAHRDRPFPYLTLYHRAMVDETWADVEQKLAAQLVEQVEGVKRGWEQTEIRIDPTDLEGGLRTITELENRPGVVIAVDEVVRLFKKTQDDAELSASLQRFCDFVARTPGLLLLWIGPVAPMRYLASDVLELLNAAHHLPVRPLTAAETRAMLQAEKLAPIHRIEVSEKVARDIHRRTAGNPFWIAHLGYEMWTLLYQRGDGAVRFTLPMVRRATSELIQLATPFQGMLLYNRDQDRLMLASLFALVETGQGSKHKRRQKLSLDELRAALASRGIEVTATVLEQSLDELMARGGICRPERAPESWQIAAPLIEDFVRHQLKLIGWEGLTTEEEAA